MRYKPDHKDLTHRRIIESAAKEFRANGFDGVGIAKLMGKLDLTHGGFYAHFEDKEDLISEALRFSLMQNLERMAEALEKGGLEGLLDLYLSEGHRDHPEEGCPLPALSAEVARHSVEARSTFSHELKDTFDRIAEGLPGSKGMDKSKRVMFLFSAMSGAIALARGVSDPALSKEILDTTRASILELFEPDLPLKA